MGIKIQKRCKEVQMCCKKPLLIMSSFIYVLLYYYCNYMYIVKAHNFKCIPFHCKGANCRLQNPFEMLHCAFVILPSFIFCMFFAFRQLGYLQRPQSAEASQQSFRMSYGMYFCSAFSISVTIFLRQSQKSFLWILFVLFQEEWVE